MDLLELKRPDGAILRGYRWPAGSIGGARNPELLIVHGLGEHAMRYALTAQWFNSRGYSVSAYDLRGHGKSDGARGVIPSGEAVLDDIGAMLAALPVSALSGKPLLLGHSMGGLLVSRYVASRGAAEISRLILSSPALDMGLNPVQKLMLSILPKLAPNLTVGNGLKVELISHDAQVIERYKADPLVHDKISGTLASFMAQSVEVVMQAAPTWPAHTLLLYAGADGLVRPAGSKRFAAAAAGTVRAKEIARAYHELFNESEAYRGPVLEALGDWLAS